MLCIHLAVHAPRPLFAVVQFHVSSPRTRISLSFLLNSEYVVYYGMEQVERQAGSRYGSV
jgi:hypothetical protein